MFKDLIYSQNIDEIHTSDAYFGKILLTDKNLLIPYINLGISNHELNKNNELKFIDFCYTVFINVDYLKIDGNFIKDNLLDKYDSKNSIYLGGDDLLRNQNVYDIEVQAKNSFLQLRDGSKISENYWLPIETPNFNKNMDIKLISDFINNKDLPENLSTLVRASRSLL